MNQVKTGITVKQHIVSAWLLVAGLCFVCFLQGCEQRNPAEKNKILAVVNGSSITQTDLDESLERLLGSQSEIIDTSDVEKKALESLVMMRAISLQQEQTLNKQELALLASRVGHYKEEILVESYLRNNTDPFIPSESDVNDYYKSHLQYFTGEPLYTYEILQANKILESELLPQVMTALSSAQEQSDWRQYSQQLKNKSLPIVYVQGRTDGPLVDKRLLKTIHSLSAEEVSDVIYLDKKPYIVRLLRYQSGKIKLFNSVRIQIRKTLATKHMKAAIKQEAEKVLSTARVEYINL